MKNLLFILMLSLGISLAYASPNADLSITPSNSGQWPAQYRLTLSVPQDHHAYLDAGEANAYIPVKLDPYGTLASAGVAISSLEKPAGEFDSSVKATVLRGQGGFVLALMPAQPGAAPAPSAALEVTYQLCNDLTHVCFRPKTTQVAVALPTVAPPVAEASPEQTESFMGALLQVFENNKDNTLVMFALMFAAGLLSVATPCVYPMLPITAVFITGRAQGQARKEKHHALAYWAGMVMTYMVLGLLAGMTGEAFNTVMQSAVVNVGFAVFFAFFALSLLGFYELSFLQNEVYALDRQSSKVKGVAGTLLMGSVAGLVISPCVGPIVFALLLQVADTIAEEAAALAAVGQSLDFWGKLTIAGQGSVMMSGFGLGVGLPFFTIGVVKFKQLPKAGYWMDKVKYAFGFMILYFAYTYLQKGLGVLGAEPSTALVLALGLAALWFAIVHCHVLGLMPADAPPQDRMRHFVGAVNLLVGGWLVVSGLGHIPGLNPTAGVLPQAYAATPATQAAAPGTSPIHQEAGIAWFRSFEAAQKAAKASGKPLFIDFYASWCANCLEFQKESASNTKLNQALREKAIAVKLIDKEPDFERFRADQAHRPLKIGLPYFAILSPDGKVTWSGTDYKAAQTMIAELDKLS
jgi:thiol:disulfide interchange protein DsbD